MFNAIKKQDVRTMVDIIFAFHFVCKFFRIVKTNIASTDPMKFHIYMLSRLLDQFYLQIFDEAYSIVKQCKQLDQETLAKCDSISKDSIGSYNEIDSLVFMDEQICFLKEIIRLFHESTEDATDPNKYLAKEISKYLIDDISGVANVEQMLIEACGL